MTQTEDIRAAIKRLIVERLFIEGLDPTEIGDDTPIAVELGLDSMDFLELTVGLEQEFGLEIVGKGVDRDAYESVNSITALVESRLAAKA
jgi:acyl carrier protein